MKGHVRRHGRGWAVVLPLPRDPVTSKRRQKWFSGYPNKTAAEHARVTLAASIIGGTYVDSADITVEQFLIGWLADYVAVNLRPKTAQTYRQIVNSYLVPHLGNVPLAQLKPVHIQPAYTALLARGLSPRTVRHANAVLRNALQMALRQQQIVRNPCDAVTLPRPVQYDYQVLEPCDLKALLEVMPPPFALPAYIAAWCGFRRGEVLGLRWEDFNEDEATLRVSQTLSRITGQGLIITTPKSQAGSRTIALSGEVVPRLRSHRAEQAEHILSLGKFYKDQGLIFTGHRGDPLGPDAFTHATKRGLIAIGKPKARLHDLRHGHATQLMRKAVSPRQIAERLGHADPALVMRTYAHATLDEDRKAAEKFAEAMRG